jgi:hypothetical protein
MVSFFCFPFNVSLFSQACISFKNHSRSFTINTIFR